MSRHSHSDFLGPSCQGPKMAFLLDFKVKNSFSRKLVDAVVGDPVRQDKTKHQYWKVMDISIYIYIYMCVCVCVFVLLLSCATGSATIGSTDLPRQLQHCSALNSWPWPLRLSYICHPCNAAPEFTGFCQRSDWSHQQSPCACSKKACIVAGRDFCPHQDAGTGPPTRRLEESWMVYRIWMANIRVDRVNWVHQSRANLCLEARRCAISLRKSPANDDFFRGENEQFAKMIPAPEILCDISSAVKNR